MQQTLLNVDINTNKIALVTGASSGIGQATAIGLAKQNAKVLVVCRDPLKGLDTLEKIKAESQNPHVKLLIGDLSDQQSIHLMTKQILEKYEQLDILIHCAGVVLSKRALTADHLEMTFAVNHLASFLLTQKLLPILKASPSSRIITVTSRAEELGKIDFDNLQCEKKYSAIRSYCQSKLANILFTYELARRLKGTKVSANCFHPGLVDSNLGRHLPKLVRTLICLVRPFMSSPTQASEALIYLATDASLDQTSGKYFIKQKAVESSKQSYDLILAKRLWDISESLVSQSLVETKNAFTSLPFL